MEWNVASEDSITQGEIVYEAGSARRLLMSPLEHVRELEVIEIESKNVKLKGSFRKQLVSWLKRSLRLAQRLGEQAVHVRVERVGGSYWVRAHVEGLGSPVDCAYHKRDLRTACRGLVQQLVLTLHNRRLQTVAA